MILLQASNISKSFGVDLILSNIYLQVQSGERVALVGRNGSGKSTLLNIIIGELEPDSGEVITAKDTTFGYLAQNTIIDSERSIYEELMTVFSDLRKTEKTLRIMEEEMADPDRFDSQEAYQQHLDAYDRLQSQFSNRGGYSYQSDVEAVLHGLNFGSYDFQTPVRSLSGGQKTRLALGKLLLKKPDLLILDEPTNHLDIETLSWLENYLQHYNGAVLLVSHDRYFLDRLVTKVYEIFQYQSFRYVGNYTDFLEQRAQNYEQQLKAYEKQQKEIAELEDFVQKNIARDSTSNRAKSRRKKLEKIERLSHPKAREKSARFSFSIQKQSGHDVLMAHNLSVGYQSDNALMDDLRFTINRGENIALVGPNGIGKTTLLKTLTGELGAVAGNVHLGSNVSIGYYSQEQAHLNPKNTVIDELWDEYPMVKEQDIRTVLGNFLFSGDDVLKRVSQLSGGEKARLALAKLMMQKNNFLIMDEPTNHLDLDSKEILESALADYPGALLFVSHDRYFINKLAEKIFELSTNGLTIYLGDYDYYVDKKTEERELAELELKNGRYDSMTKDSSAAENNEGQEHYLKSKEYKRTIRKLERSIETIEEEIEKLELESEGIEKELSQPNIYDDAEAAQELNEALEAVNKKLSEQVEQWESLQTEFEKITG